MENQHRLIKGYRELSAKEIDNMNLLKALEIEVLMLFQNIAQTQQVEGRWMAIARTHIEQGFMAAGRAVARPEGYPEQEPQEDRGADNKAPVPTEPDRVAG